MANIASQLMAALERTLGMPVAGCTIRDLADRTTWTVQCRPSATADERQAVAAFVQTYDPQQDTQRIAEEDAARLSTEKALTALLITGLWGRLGRRPTAEELAQERARWREVYQAL